MPLPVYRLRRWLATTAVLFTMVVAGMYFYARQRQRNALRDIPHKIGYDIKQTASGFQFSKSDGGRTLFTIQANDLKQFKLNGRAELHNVSIILYGRDSSRFDQIYGDDFAYDPKSGDVTAKGDVQIDIEANPSGLVSPDQAAPKELKNPIHLKTRDLVFNKETGNASTGARIEFRTPQATGWAVGAQYAGRSNTLTLVSQIHVFLTGANAAIIRAERGTITNEPRQIVLEYPQLQRNGGTLQADQATFILGPDNNVERVLATGNVIAETQVESKRREKTQTQPAAASNQEPSTMRARADEAELLLTGKQNQLRTATLIGNVQVERIGIQSLQGSAGRVIADFSGRNQLQKVHATQAVRLVQQAASTETAKAGGSGPQDFELTAPIIDFFVAKGRFLDRAVTSGAAQITILSAQDRPNNPQALPAQRTVVTAGRFEAKFGRTPEGRTRLASIHGAPDARIVSLNSGQPDRVSTSQSVDATFLPRGGIESIAQQGNVSYADGQSPDKRMQARADMARYTPSDQMLSLIGNPRVTNGGMATTARTIRINRATGDAIADGDVKSTYSELKEQPNGALLASASPIHATARSMTAHSSPAVAIYSGNARLWQDANVIEAPTIQFDRERRFVEAQGTLDHPVSTVLIQLNQPEASPPEKGGGAAQKQEKKPGRSGMPSSIVITASRLTYADAERKAHYEDGVLAKGTGFTASARTLDACLLPHSQTLSSQSLAGVSQLRPGQLDRIVAQGNVVIQQPNRRAEGQTLVYTAAEDKFVLTGGSPSIFDAERGKIIGVSLTFFRHDDRVLVEGAASTPVVTQTRVAR